jgi:ketosteroid isomerase-like protein
MKNQQEVVAIYKSGDKELAYAEFKKSTKNGASFEKFCAAMNRMLDGWKA